MLGGFKIVAFVATTDGAKARSFYEGLLGLDVISDDEFATVLDANGVELRIQKVKAFMPQAHTQLGWRVAAIEDVVQTLRLRGVACERFPSLRQDALGIWVAPSGAKVAWFKDPDGNLLSLSEPKSD
jgi:catechol 2,3-dioxygenase-like lactoylglutathione lyase family enzyme